jgi:hypothetical protein
MQAFDKHTMANIEEVRCQQCSIRHVVNRGDTITEATTKQHPRCRVVRTVQYTDPAQTMSNLLPASSLFQLFVGFEEAVPG